MLFPTLPQAFAISNIKKYPSLLSPAFHTVCCVCVEALITVAALTPQTAELTGLYQEPVSLTDMEYN